MTTLYLDRGAWGASTSLPRKGYVVPVSQFRKLVVHHTVMVQQDYDHDGIREGDMQDISTYMRSLQTARPDLGLDVPYSFVVFPGANLLDGIVCEGRGFNRTGAHTAGLNSTAWGIAIAGDTREMSVTPGMVEAIKWVGRKLQVDYPRPTTPHSDHKATACPGPNGDAIIPLVQPPFARTDLPAPQPPTEQEDEMPHIWLDTTTDETWLCQGRIRRVMADANGPTGLGFAGDNPDVPVLRNANARLIVPGLYPELAQ